MYHSNSQLTSWVGVNGPVHVGKEDKQVKQHYYVTSSSEIILMNVHHNMTLTSNKSTSCRIPQESINLHGWHVVVVLLELNKRVSIYMDGMWSTEILTNSCVFSYEWYNMTECGHERDFNSQLTGNWPRTWKNHVHGGRKVDKQGETTLLVWSLSSRVQ